MNCTLETLKARLGEDVQLVQSVQLILSALRAGERAQPRYLGLLYNYTRIPFSW